MMEVELGGVEDVDGIPQACQEKRLASGMQQKDMKRKQKRNSSRFESHSVMFKNRAAVFVDPIKHVLRNF